MFDEQFDRLAERPSIKLHPEILRLSKKIATGFSKIQSINSDNYLVTILWIASKIVLIRPYEPETLGLSKPRIIGIEREICNISRFKFLMIQ